MDFIDIQCDIDVTDLNLVQLAGGRYAVRPRFEVSGLLIKDSLSMPFDPDIKIVIENGFTCDLISAPEFILNKYGISKNSYPIASIVHDKLFKSGIAITSNSGAPISISQKEADYIFRQLLIHYGCDKKLAHMMYKVLRNWGWFAWIRWRLFSLFKSI